MKLTFYQKIILTLFYCLIFIMLLNNSFSYLDNDFGWHLKTGEDISLEKQIPHSNYYNFTLENMSWVDHEWFFNFILFQTHQRAGYIVLSLFFVTLIVALLLLQLFFIKKHFVKNNRGLFFIVFLQALGIIASRPHLGVRMQEISLVFLFFLLVLVYYYNKTEKTIWLFGLPLLFYVWAIMHGSFPIGLFLLFVWPVIKVLENYLARFNFTFLNFSQILPFKKILNFLIFACLSLVATLITPYGLSLYSFLSGYKNTFYLSHLSEWLGQSSFPFQYWQLLYLAIIVSFFLLSLYLSLIKKNYRLKLWDIFLLLLFIPLSFKSRRHFPLMFIATLPFAVEFLIFSFQNNEKKSTEKNLASRIFCFFVSACLVLAIASQTINIHFTNKPFSTYCRKFPCGAVNYLNANPQLKNLRVFNDYNYGGYLIWTMPDMKIFIDGRFPQFAYGEHTFLEEYYEFFDADKTNKKLEEHNIELILMGANNPFPKVRWFERLFFGVDETKSEDKLKNFHDFMTINDNWKKIYSDETAIIYSKK